MIHTQKLYANDFEFIVRAYSRFVTESHKIIDIMEDIPSIASNAFTTTLYSSAPVLPSGYSTTSVPRSNRGHPQFIVAVTISLFTIQFRIFSNKRLEELFQFLSKLEQRIKAAEL